MSIPDERDFPFFSSLLRQPDLVDRETVCRNSRPMEEITLDAFHLDLPADFAEHLDQAAARAAELLGRQLHVGFDWTPVHDSDAIAIRLAPRKRLSAGRDLLAAIAMHLRGELGGLATFEELGALIGSFPAPQGVTGDPLELMKMSAEFRKQHTGETVTVGHPDTGFTLHPELFDSGVGGLDLERDRNFVEGDGTAEDPCAVEAGWLHPGHGTGTASRIISASSEPGPNAPADWLDIVGVAPRSSLIPYRVTKSVALVRYSQQRALARALSAAIEARADVVSISLGSLWSFEVLEDAVARAVESGLIICAAAGQVRLTGSFHLNRVVAPACLPGVFCAASCDLEGRASGWSFRSSRVDITVPGEGIPIAVTEFGRKWNTGRSNGTSYSAAHLAGAAALWVAAWKQQGALTEANRDRRPAMFWSALQRSHKDAVQPVGGKTGHWGLGILDVPALVGTPPDVDAGALPGTEADQLVDRGAIRQLQDELGLDEPSAQLFALATTQDIQLHGLTSGGTTRTSPLVAAARVRDLGLSARDIRALAGAGIGAFATLRL
jgi:hypothetical protein